MFVIGRYVITRTLGVRRVLSLVCVVGCCGRRDERGKARDKAVTPALHRRETAV